MAGIDHRISANGRDVGLDGDDSWAGWMVNGQSFSLADKSLMERLTFIRELRERR